MFFKFITKVDIFCQVNLTLIIHSLSISSGFALHVYMYKFRIIPISLLRRTKICQKIFFFFFNNKRTKKTDTKKKILHKNIRWWWSRKQEAIKNAKSTAIIVPIMHFPSSKHKKMYIQREDKWIRKYSRSEVSQMINNYDGDMRCKEERRKNCFVLWEFLTITNPLYHLDKRSKKNV